MLQKSSTGIVCSKFTLTTSTVNFGENKNLFSRYARVRCRYKDGCPMVFWVCLRDEQSHASGILSNHSGVGSALNHFWAEAGFWSF